MHQLTYDTEEKHGTLLKTSISPENGWLEDDPFLLGPGLFSGANCFCC